MNPYGSINRYRGTKSKLLGCLFMGLPAAVISGAAWTLAGYWYIGLYTAVIGIMGAFICLWWWTDSEDWRHSEIMAEQWRNKGFWTFILLGNPFGFLLESLGDVYAEDFTSTKEDKEAVERAEGSAWGLQSFLTACAHALAAFLVWRFL